MNFFLFILVFVLNEFKILCTSVEGLSSSLLVAITGTFDEMLDTDGCLETGSVVSL
jgi:hypothetical protein